MSKFKKETLERLGKWCDSQDTQFSRFSFEEKNGMVTVYRYDGHGLPRKINSFVNDKEIESFLNKDDELERELSEYAVEIEKEMMSE
ncbi:TPA: hypothetical protein ACOTG0_002117 [Clostridium perfringens]|nr:hypothetical protein phiCPD_00030 [Clostridium phage phiCp-D]